MARGEYIAFQDDDDLMPPERIINLYEALCHYPQALFAVGDWIVIDHEGKSTGRRSKVNIKTQKEDVILIEDGYKAVLWPFLTPAPHTTLFRKTDGERIGWFDVERFFHSCEDTDFFARLGQLGPIVYVSKVVSYYRQGHESMCRNNFPFIYSRFLLLEKHLLNAKAERKDLNKRLKARMLDTLKGIAFLKKYGARLPDSFSGDYLNRGLSLIGLKKRLAYRYYALIRLTIRRLLIPKVDSIPSLSYTHKKPGVEH